MIREACIDGWVREHRFHEDRKWRFDFAWKAEKVAVELEGGSWVSGRHSRGAGFQEDCEKYNRAAMEGWLVLRFTPAMLGGALYQVRDALEIRRNAEKNGNH